MRVITLDCVPSATGIPSPVVRWQRKDGEEINIRAPNGERIRCNWPFSLSPPLVALLLSLMTFRIECAPLPTAVPPVVRSAAVGRWMAAPPHRRHPAPSIGGLSDDTSGFISSLIHQDGRNENPDWWRYLGRPPAPDCRRMKRRQISAP